MSKQLTDKARAAIDGVAGKGAPPQRRIWLMVRVPVHIEKNGVGLFYATSPLIKGLLVAERTEEEAIQAIYNAVDELGTATVP